MSKEELLKQYKDDLKQIENMPNRVLEGDQQYTIPCVSMSISHYRSLLEQVIIGLSK